MRWQLGHGRLGMSRFPAANRLNEEPTRRAGGSVRRPQRITVGGCCLSVSDIRLSSAASFVSVPHQQSFVFGANDRFWVEVEGRIEPIESSKLRVRVGLACSIHAWPVGI